MCEAVAMAVAVVVCKCSCSCMPVVVALAVEPKQPISCPILKSIFPPGLWYATMWHSVSCFFL